jgi:hypothetical protein
MINIRRAAVQENLQNTQEVTIDLDWKQLSRACQPGQSNSRAPAWPHTSEGLPLWHNKKASHNGGKPKSTAPWTVSTGVEVVKPWHELECRTRSSPVLCASTELSMILIPHPTSIPRTLVACGEIVEATFGASQSVFDRDSEMCPVLSSRLRQLCSLPSPAHKSWLSSGAGLHHMPALLAHMISPYPLRCYRISHYCD